MVASWLALLPYNKKVLSLTPPSVKFPCLSCLRQFSSGAPAKTVGGEVRLSGNSEFPISVNGCVSLYVRLVTCSGCTMSVTLWQL